VNKKGKEVKYHISALVEKGRGEKYRKKRGQVSYQRFRKRKGVKYHISALVEKGRGEKYRKDFHHGSHLGQILGTDDFADIALKISNQGMNKPKE